MYYYFTGLSFEESLLITDPGYGFLNYFSHIVGFSDTILVNFLCSIFFYLSFILFTLALAVPFSTLADRFNLYLIIFVFSYLFSILNAFNKQVILWSIIFFNSAMLIIWLNFGAWSHAWLPYQNFLLNYIIELI